MVKAAAGPILHRFVGPSRRPPRAALADHELLEHFRAEQDQAASQVAAACSSRDHGAHVCRSVLGLNDADAEDAFQATFLILARKAGSIRKTAAARRLAPRRRPPHRPRASDAGPRPGKHEARAPESTTPSLSNA